MHCIELFCEYSLSREIKSKSLMRLYIIHSFGGAKLHIMKYYVLVGISSVLLLVLVLTVSFISFARSTFPASRHTKICGHNEAQSSSALQMILLTVPAFTTS